MRPTDCREIREPPGQFGLRMKSSNRDMFPPVVLAAALVFLTTGLREFSAATGPSTPRGPFGADVSCLAIDPEDSRRLYLGTTRGSLFTSSDGGRSWNPGARGLFGSPVETLAVAPSNPPHSLPCHRRWVGLQEFQPGRHLDRPIARVARSSCQGPAGRSSQGVRRLCGHFRRRGVQDKQRRESLEGQQPGVDGESGRSPGSGSPGTPDSLRRYPAQGSVQESGRRKDLEEKGLERPLDYRGGGGSSRTGGLVCQHR